MQLPAFLNSLHLMKRLLLVWLTACTASSALAQADDTSRAAMQLLGDDSALVKTLFARRAVAPAATPAARSSTDSLLAHYYITHHANALSLKYLLSSAKEAEASGDSMKTAWAHNWLGAFYKSQRDFPRALTSLNRGLRIFMAAHNRSGMGAIYNGLGDVHENQGNYTEALQYYRLSLNTIKPTGDKASFTWPYYNIGEVYMFQGRYDSALTYYDSALTIQLAVTDFGAATWTYSNIAEVLTRLGKYRDAEQSALRGLAIADSLHQTIAVIRAQKNLSAIYEALQDYKKAFEHHKAYTALQAQAGNEEVVRNLVKHQMQYDFDKKEEMGKLAQQDKDRRNMILAIGLVLIVMILGGVAYLQRRANKLKADLLRQKEETVQQKEVLMKEIHHRVKNNLQITGVLLDVQLAQVQDEQARVALRESITRLNAISLIHHQLYRNDQAAEIEFSQFADSLHQQLHELFGKRECVVELINHIPATVLDIDTAVPLGLILNELITNSYKHAFSQPVNTIMLHVHHGNGQYTLTYKDSGPGLQQYTNAESGLGTVIIRNLSRQVGGEFRYDRQQQCFIVTFRSAADMRRTA